MLQSLWFDYEQTVYAVADVQREEPHLDEIKSQVDAIHESVGNESTSLYSVSNYLTDQLPRINDSLQVVSTQVSSTVCLKKTGPLRLKRHNFINSQHLLIIFGRDGPYSILN